ncbi:elongin A, like [Betta splendens]|uniref:Elongin A, like n=1 Tax=Betta splendens TaxID=158456 RepID=A0A6P7PVZ0_BETSP|nr:elongin A, like [Betta splendens]
MASGSDVAEKVMRFKHQLANTADSATVLKILGKLKDLDITLEILVETGIGKAVNALRRHEKAGEFAKSLVKGWKKLIPKDSASNTGEQDVSVSLSVKDKLDEEVHPCTGNVAEQDLNNNCLTSRSKSPGSSDEALSITGKRKADSETEQCKELDRKGEQTENQEKDQQENQNVFDNIVLAKKVKLQEGKRDEYASKRKKRNHSDQWRENKNSEETATPKSEDKQMKKSSSDSGRCEPEKSKQKSKSSNRVKESSRTESSDKNSKPLKLANVTDKGCSEMSRSSEAPNRKRKESSTERQKHKQESELKDQSKHKKAQVKHKGGAGGRQKEPSMSFESFLNYDVNASKRKERQVKKPKKIKQSATKRFKSPVLSIHVASLKQEESFMDLMNLPLPAALPECDKLLSVEYFDKPAEKEPELDISEDPAVFTGQRLNKKMQVYSGAKTVFLPTMMSLYQQCIRTLQNNINLLHETGGVPFEILEPVFERCTPEQLLRIEESNPIYIGVTDHLWGKHCQRDFKDSKLQEYESWKEMYIRLSEERESKFKRLTKSIVSAHSKKPRGRQVKMAFIHTVAKPPRNVRIQQEIHGTAAQQPHQKCSVKTQDSRPKQTCSEQSRSSSTSSGASNPQDSRKKTRVAPMMAKSLKAFKKQLGRR